MRRLLLLCALARCACDPKLNLDAGTFFCLSDLDCAESYACIDGVCSRGGAGGGAELGGGAGGGGIVDGGGGGGGFLLSGGVAFTTPARSAVQDKCSQPVAFQLLDDAGATLVAPFDLPVQIFSAPSMSFFTDDACQVPASFVTVPQGLGGNTLRFKGSSPGVFVVTLTASQLTPALQSQSIVPPGMNAVVFTTAPPGVSLAGTCVGPFTVQRQDPAGVPQPADVDGGSLDLSVAPPGATAYLDAQCTQPAGAMLALAPDAAVATFWLSSATGATYTVQVGGTFLTAGQQVATFAPWVRRGVCDLSALSIRSCQLVPPVLDFNRTLFLYQATSAETLAQRVEATCVLHNDGGTITCARGDNIGNVAITWQTVELPGAQVGRYETTCLGDGGLTQILPLDTPVPASSTFTVLDSNAHGTDPNANDFFSVANDGTQLTLKWELQCQSDNIRMQVVRWPWANVLHTSGSLMTPVSGTAQQVGVADGGFFALGTWRSDSPIGVTAVLCDRLVRPEATSDKLIVTRGALSMDPLCTATSITGFELERVELGPHAVAQPLVVSMDAGTATVSVAIATVDPTRTFLLASGQSGGMGQAAGEGALVRLSDGGAPLGEVGAVLTLTDPSHVQVTRGTAYDSATFTVYVVEIEP